MVAPQAFKVLTEFKFDVGAAVVSSGKLQDAVGKVSDKADEALFSLQRLSSGIVFDLGLGGGSLLGFLGQAIKSSEQFRKSQLDFTNLISSNMHVLSGDIGTFNDKMNVSKNILKDIAKDAAKFGLREGDLASQTKQTAAMLVPKGLAGPNFKNARDLSRNLLKSAPSLGVDPGLVQGQLSRTIEGRASQGDTLFIRLVNETEAFQKKVGGAANAAKAFNKLPLKERFATLQAGMAQFASDADVLAGRANTFSQIFQNIRNVFTGLNGVLKPIGDAIVGPIKDGLQRFIKLVNTDGRRIFEELAKGVITLIPDLQTMIVNLIQLKKVAGDFNKAAKASSIVGIFHLISGFGIMGTAIKFLSKAIGPLMGMITRLVPVIMAGLGPALTFLGSALMAVVPWFLAFLGIFQLLSRAFAIAKVEDAKVLPGIIADIMESLNRLKDAFMIMAQPLFNLFEGMARFLSPLFSMQILFGLLRTGMELLEKVVVSALAGMHGAMFAILGIIENLKEGKILGAFDDINKDFQAGTNSFLDQVFKTGDDEKELGAVQSNVNISKVEINQDFKERFEPDRVAFSVKDQLMKLSQNPTQAAGSGFALTGQGR